MAVPSEGTERKISLRRFLGVSSQLDSTFLGPQYLQAAQNFVPDRTFLLAKRPGTDVYLDLPAGVLGIPHLAYELTLANRCLFAYGQRAAGPGDAVYRSLDDGAFALVSAFASAGRVGRSARLGDYLYIGNGVDPLKRITLAGTSTDLAALGTLATAGSSLTPTAITATDNTPRILTGTYSAAWAIFDTSTGLYISRSVAQTFVIGANQFLTATAPSGVLGANQVYRLFIAALNLPVEFATAQSDSFAASQVHTFTEIGVTEDRIPLANGLIRTGNILLTRGNRIVMAGSETDPNAVCATAVLWPGREQAIYNRGSFFEAYARLTFPTRVTAIGTAAMTDANDPRAPLVVFQQSRATLFTNDPFSPEGSSERVEMSDEIGCDAPDTVTHTTIGLCFLGPESVYMIPPGGGFPVDIGWPIADVIRAIPAPVRTNCLGWFHKGFYKLYICQPGTLLPLQGWWLDLRRGLGDVPSWWGPMAGFVPSAATTGHHPAEPSRGWAAEAGTTHVRLVHREGFFRDLTAPVVSYLKTGKLDDTEPFITKSFTRLRFIGQSAAPTSLTLQFHTENDVSWPIEQANFRANTGGMHWDTDSWNVSTWTTESFEEVQSITPGDRPRGLAAEITVTHADPIDVQLRDVEVLYLPSARKVRYVDETSQPEGGA